MIAFLSGTIEYLTGDTVVIDVGGVGYEVNISAEGETVYLYFYAGRTGCALRLHVP